MALTLKCGQFNRLYSIIRTSQRFCSVSSSNKKGLVLGVYSDDENGVQLTPAAEEYNNVSKGKLLDHIKLAGCKVKAGKSFVFWGLDEEYQSVAVVGLGKKTKEFNEIELLCEVNESVRVAASAGCRALEAAGIKDIFVEDLENAEAAAEGSILGTWKFQEYKSKKEKLPCVQLYECSKSETGKWNRGAIKANSQNIARRLADTPANLMTPTIFSENVTDLLKSSDIDVKVYDKEWAQKQKMCSFLAVGQGSSEPSKFVEITYNKGNPDDCPYVLVGKGVTFDAGGISLKPSLNMDQMRADMGGAASVVATLYGVSQLNIPVNLKVLIPLVENLPSSKALKPGDVITARNGKTICVDNTDAEGRLILADALCYSAEFNPKWVLDIATLTGAMAVALGNSATGVFTNCNKLYSILEDAGSSTGDRVWRFPLWKHYKKQIAENAAYDLNNVGKGKGGGSCTAAAFLREFVPSDTKWLHLDMASVMGPDDCAPYICKGMTGRPTRTLIQFIENQPKSC